MWLIISLTLLSSSKYSYLKWKFVFIWTWSLLLLLWNFYILAMNGCLGESIWWNSIYPEKVEPIYSCTFICTTKQPGWPFDRDCHHCYSALLCSSFLFKANHICSQKQVPKFITIILKCGLHLRAEPATVKVKVLPRLTHAWLHGCSC